MLARKLTAFVVVTAAIVGSAMTAVQAYGEYVNPTQVESPQNWSNPSIWQVAHGGSATGSVPSATQGVYLADGWAGGTAASITLNLDTSAEIASMDVCQSWTGMPVRSGTLNLLAGAALTLNTHQAEGADWSNRLTIGCGSAGNGTINQYAGSTLTVGCTGVEGLTLAMYNGATGVYHMYDGELIVTTGSIDQGTGNGTFEFDAGVIYLPSDQTGFAAANSWFHANGVGYTETYNAGADSTMLHYVVPEPTSLLLLGIGLAGLLAYAWKKRK